MKDVFEILKESRNLKISQEDRDKIHKKITELFYNDLGQVYVNSEYDEETEELNIDITYKAQPLPHPINITIEIEN